MDPDISREVTALDSQDRPGFAAFGVSFVCGAAAEGKGETNDETKHCKQEGRYANYRCLEANTRKLESGLTRGDEFVEACNECCPSRNHGQRNNHSWQNAAMHSQKVWEF